MKHLKKFIIPTILITVVVGLFYFADREKYFIGKSYFDYKLLPYGLRPEYFCNPDQFGDGMKYEFKIKMEEYTYFPDCCCYCDSNLDRILIIERIVGYYFSESSFFAVCYDTNNKVHYITPFVLDDNGNDIVMINANVEAESLRGLRYIEAPDPITVEDYYENYNLWRRIPLWLKL
jgi:hypothetical protein